MAGAITVTILKWDNYNPRKDYKRPWWFALSNRLLEDPDFFSFSDAEIRAWIYILSQASQRSSAEVRIYFDHASRVCNVKPSALKSAIKKLVEIGVLTASVQDPNGICTESVRYITEQNITEQNNIAQKDLSVFDFDSLYQKYPRKVGKQKGISKLKAQIRTQKDFEGVSIALSRYIDHCKANASEQRFIKHFSTWVSEWRDWLDPSAGAGQDFSTNGSGLSLAERLARKGVAV